MKNNLFKNLLIIFFNIFIIFKNSAVFDSNVPIVRVHRVEYV